MLVAYVNRSRLSPSHDRPVATHNAAETTPRASNSDAGGLGEVCASSRTPTGRVHGEWVAPSTLWSSRWFEAGSAYDHHTIAMCKEPCEVEALA